MTVNLYSDTQTLPTAAMRRAIAEAPVGDEQRGEDPSVNALCERVAALLGQEAALFLPSGTMCNEIALAVHCRPGDEVLADVTSHLIHFEAGAPAALAGVLIGTLPGKRGIFQAADVDAAARPNTRHAPRQRLVSIENTANLGGGTVWPLATVAAVAQAARGRGLSVHMDGARLMNAVVASGTPAADYGRLCDSLWIDLTKGLGCPVGAVLAGGRDFIEEAWRLKHRWGGAMRQAGILAAAGLHALDHHIDRLADDHAHARILAQGLVGLPGVAVDLDAVETNMVYLDVTGTGLGAPEIVQRLKAHAIVVGALSPTNIRAVTHLDVDRAGIDRAIDAFAAVLGR
ncbi:L-threonine aldolase [Stella humosa]|uniref:L-threonine aldolase n=1 Tax=Stella humosa TaxID=94 RepID=A0A3N1KPW3_9PROT|nr:GntG family PLP-dependent aldolase [Stella humosa]ROP83823.1 L-threonine aldolase [Stella humosa]BBK32916.1 threonine aldolase [Stella humosa]